MAQYDDPRNPFSAGRPEAGSPWGESNPGPSSSRDGLQLPGEAEPGGWGRDGQPRTSPVARRRNQWRQHQQLAPDFGPASVEPEIEPVIRPAARNASLPAFRRGPAQPPPSRPRPTAPKGQVFEPRPAPLNQAAPPIAPRPGAPPLQMHPHSIHPSTLNPNGAVAPSRGATAARALPPNVTPLRPQSRRTAIAPTSSPSQRSGLSTPGALEESSNSSGTSNNPPSPRRSRAAKARRRLANPPLPLLYLIRLIILGVGVAAIAGTLLSVLSPSNVAAPGETPPAQANPGRTAGSLVQGTAATVTDLRLTGEISHLKGELEQLATLTPGLTPVSFAVDLDSGQYIDLGGAEPVASASTIKVPILVAFLQQVDAGNLALNQSMALQEEYMANGSGTLRGEAVGTEYTALEIATRMIVASDNTATNMMIASLGGIEALNQTFAAWGLEHTLLRNPLPDLDGTNTTSAKDLTLLMALIDQGGLLTPRSRDRLFSIMQRTENGSLIPSGIRDGSLLANKTGDISAMLGDVALVDVPNGKRYALAVLVQRPANDGRASELIRRMTETIHTEMAQPVAPVGGGSTNPAPLSPPGEFETEPLPDEFETQIPQEYEDPYAPAPVDLAPPNRAPSRDEIPPG
ncbi:MULTISPECIES: serine hydrolase [Cyanophyceae]|uniref:serine hydrolase n=1 Tax=Cyanophyceae TaxID=3028117 RepID=UPI0016857698|nr:MULTISPECIES: serine hydrolase [Cyanophyceae]MBD1919271.1 serine hydrolase [Phormidium sp. FACHB-77]MBD2032990.1 serine hydrolase [Phormidium sp. FACHB-322]MBD2054178.1 serine hydrolase [Leptolyngbya sp. FACHB-60]